MSYLYYAYCEERLQVQRTLGCREEERIVDWMDYGAHIAQQFCGQSKETMNI